MKVDKFIEEVKSQVCSAMNEIYLKHSSEYEKRGNFDIQIPEIFIEIQLNCKGEVCGEHDIPVSKINITI